MPEIRIYPDLYELSLAAANKFSGFARQHTDHGNRFCVALSGGSTPKLLYKLISGSVDARNGLNIPTIDWDRVHIFWADERCVSPNHPASNYRLVRENLLDNLLIPEENVHRMPGELAAAQAAKEYEALLRTYFTGETTFDLVLLGMGTDGHTASLFPGTPAVFEKERWVAAIPESPQPPYLPRLSLTLPAINASREVVFLVSGDEKAKTLKRVLTSGLPAPMCPASMVNPTHGSVTWFIDQAAAGELDG